MTQRAGGGGASYVHPIRVSPGGFQILDLPVFLVEQLDGCLGGAGTHDR